MSQNRGIVKAKMYILDTLQSKQHVDVMFASLTPEAARELSTIQLMYSDLLKSTDNRCI